MTPPELIGVRAWRLVGERLWSLYRPVEWPPGTPVEARCMTVATSTQPHPTPSRLCRCGLYAASRATEDSNKCSDAEEGLETLLGLPKGTSGDVVLGEVRGWGHAEVATKGWRAQFQRVHAIYDTRPDAGHIAAVYDVPLVRV